MGRHMEREEREGRQVRDGGLRGNAGRPGGRWPHRRPVTVAVSGLAVVAAVLGSTVLSTAGNEAAGGHTGARDHAGARGGQGTAAGSAVAGKQASAARPGEDPKPEKCEDGRNPAAGLKASGAEGDAVKRIKDKDKLVVGVDQNSYLWGYRDPASGDIEGFDISLVKTIARDLLGKDGADKITYKTIPTDQRIPAIQSGEVDMVVRTMTIACDRLDKVAFSTAYFEAGQQLLVPKKNARVKGFDKSMRGKRVCYASGSTAESMMKSPDYRSLGAKPVVVPNQLDCLVRLQLGEADATVTDSALGAGQAAQDPTVELIGEPETVEPYGVAMNLKDKDLVRRVNKVLEDFRKSGWRSSYDRWLADDMMGTEDKKPSPPKALYRD
ncbi:MULTISPECIES: glutamate ABC transporter substrate-binding protein [unclassified Streptomyces]|uniref:glutamate ABC transporter substrate-binding protein n=1 Tax=unclassified Streptomyces TaxID=2593676 RepID=UPI002DDB34E6|nr:MULTISPECIES: glutamate ABC transporter substrate-binding protein [unclassified Streptomyces]WSA94731.1 glutamate ABC transporter substrate-binding protein [Streptomyces sp. NBC_01795]WSB79151.1 glutamate ABC transporter substrate-binding protein [Streptomyces sp. NBC_01775]WSS12647.1 glutamate ABC transporter substrate-binding protein [Streptomyces sp. NBC_01186]WSS41432.1 glutamate ABC transporter substrate-binding protein [Streptomyces sp. NBC_01187]